MYLILQADILTSFYFSFSDSCYQTDRKKVMSKHSMKRATLVVYLIRKAPDNIRNLKLKLILMTLPALMSKIKLFA